MTKHSTRRVHFLILAATIAFALQAGNAEAGYKLLNHPDGGVRAQGGYGLRLDHSSFGSGVQTFNFEASAGGVELNFDVSNNQATITGIVKHNQNSVDTFYHLETILSNVEYTSDGTAAGPWWNETQSAPLDSSVYQNALEDLKTNGISTFGVNEMDLKDGTKAFDRLAFNTVVVKLTNVSDSNDVHHFNQFPNNATDIPFMFTKGHRLSGAPNDIAGFGWLEQTGQDPQFRQASKDFLFLVGDQTDSDTEQEPVPEPASILMMALGCLGVCGYAYRRRRITAAVAA